jgi:hypothetical protein
MQGWFNIHESLSIIQLINRSKDKNHLIIPIDVEKAFSKIQNHFMIKALMKLRIKRMYLNIIKTIYDKHIIIIILNGEKTEILSAKVTNETRVSFSPLQFSMVLEFLAR